MISRQARDQYERKLRASLRAKAPELAKLFASVSDMWGYEDPIYRFYHQSFKVYYLQRQTEEIVKELRSLLPDRPMNSSFAQIVKEGTGREFAPEDNERWLAVTRPILEALFHARYFLEMACRYSEAPPEDQPMPSGWAALLYLFDLR